jgi:hypothetical protein
MDKLFLNKLFLIVMSANSEIPCSLCHKWSAEAQSFSCNPNKCQKLSEWLYDHAQKELSEELQIIDAPIQYVV